MIFLAIISTIAAMYGLGVIAFGLSNQHEDEQ